MVDRSTRQTGSGDVNLAAEDTASNVEASMVDTHSEVHSEEAEASETDAVLKDADADVEAADVERNDSAAVHADANAAQSDADAELGDGTAAEGDASSEEEIGDGREVERERDRARVAHWNLIDDYIDHQGEERFWAVVETYLQMVDNDARIRFRTYWRRRLAPYLSGLKPTAPAPNPEAHSKLEGGPQTRGNVKSTTTPMTPTSIKPATKVKPTIVPYVDQRPGFEPPSAEDGQSDGSSSGGDDGLVVAQSPRPVVQQRVAPEQPASLGDATPEPVGPSTERTVQPSAAPSEAGQGDEDDDTLPSTAGGPGQDVGDPMQEGSGTEATPPASPTPTPRTTRSRAREQTKQVTSEPTKAPQTVPVEATASPQKPLKSPRKRGPPSPSNRDSEGAASPQKPLKSPRKLPPNEESVRDTTESNVQLRVEEFLRRSVQRLDYMRTLPNATHEDILRSAINVVLREPNLSDQRIGWLLRPIAYIFSAQAIESLRGQTREMWDSIDVARNLSRYQQEAARLPRSAWNDPNTNMVATLSDLATFRMDSASMTLQELFHFYEVGLRYQDMYDFYRNNDRQAEQLKAWLRSEGHIPNRLNVNIFTSLALQTLGREAAQNPDAVNDRRERIVQANNIGAVLVHLVQAFGLGVLMMLATMKRKSDLSRIPSEAMKKVTTQLVDEYPPLRNIFQPIHYHISQWLMSQSGENRKRAVPTPTLLKLINASDATLRSKDKNTNLTQLLSETAKLLPVPDVAGIDLDSGIRNLHFTEQIAQGPAGTTQEQQDAVMSDAGVGDDEHTFLDDDPVEDAGDNDDDRMKE